MPDLRSYQVILINTSAGKDSQAMMDYVVAEADAAGVRDRLVALHCDLGNSPGGEPIEWPGTMELAREHAAHYGIRFLVVKRKVRGFLEEVENRGAWPSNGQRYCTSYFKRDQGATILTMLAAEARKRMGGVPRLLNCFGFRAQESPRRKKLPVWEVNDRCSNIAKYVADWLPIHKWTVEEVWARIKQAGTRHHYAYDRGMTRLSCRFCIFAPKSQLMISARENPKLFAEYLAVEKKIGHTFRVKLPLVEVQAALDRGEAPEADDGAWNM